MESVIWGMAVVTAIFVTWLALRLRARIEDCHDDEVAEALAEIEADVPEGTHLTFHQHHYIEVPYWVQYLARRNGMSGRTETHARQRQPQGF